MENYALHRKQLDEERRLKEVASENSKLRAIANLVGEVGELHRKMDLLAGELEHQKQNHHLLSTIVASKLNKTEEEADKDDLEILGQTSRFRLYRSGDTLALGHCDRSECLEFPEEDFKSLLTLLIVHEKMSGEKDGK